MLKTTTEADARGYS